MTPASTLDQSRVREIALSLPETHESSHRGRPDLRVANRIFATLPPDGLSVNIRVTPTNLDALVTADPATYRDVWGGTWVGVELARVDAATVRGLLEDAWRLVAPTSLVSALDGAAPTSHSRDRRAP